MTKNLIVGNSYFLNGKNLGKLKKKELSGSGGSGSQEPIYHLEFEKGNYTKDWQEKFTKSKQKGGKKTRKSKRSGRKTYRRRR